ncbi:MAG: decaprenyl-phosphate phosphoribosyltransferase [Thermoanaerobaculia bacterium]|nr:decaprenyl-phosphate phosphoribosyltransferase [Thermoanaerobaculia bacterium]
MIGPLLKSLRPVQWVKNVFVLAPVVFAEHLADPELLFAALVSFATFCLAASCIYLINDLGDREEDRLHPLKKHRPIAAGELPVFTAGAAAIVLAVLTIGASLYLGLGFLMILVVYLAVNIAYSRGLKHVVILDVMVVSSGYVLRVMAGAEAIQVRVSPWLLLCTVFLALLLILSKRRHELLLLADDAGDHRAVLQHYSATFLDQMINVVTASSVVCFALYAMDDDTVSRFGDRLIYTLPLVIFGIFRYLYLIYQKHERRNPTEALMRDVPFVVNIFLWGFAVLWIVYGGVPGGT